MQPNFFGYFCHFQNPAQSWQIARSAKIRPIRSPCMYRTTGIIAARNAIDFGAVAAAATFGGFPSALRSFAGAQHWPEPCRRPERKPMSRAARFFSVQRTKTGKNWPKRPQNRSNGHKIYEILQWNRQKGHGHCEIYQTCDVWKYTIWKLRLDICRVRLIEVSVNFYSTLPKTCKKVSIIVD
jgi:hypothetical protein